MKKLKRIPFEGMSNLRDLGGYAAGDGMTRWHTFYRCDLPLCDKAGWNTLYDVYGIRCVIDLRSSAEVNYQTYEYQHPNMNILHRPLIKEDVDIKHMSSNEMFRRSMAESYLMMVEVNPEGVVQILEDIAENLQKGAILYHCTAGKDRTGIISFFLYTLAGVSCADIMADYQVSSTYNLYGNDSTNHLLKDLHEQKTDWMHSQPENLGALIDYFMEHDIETWLIEHGMKQESIKQIKKMMIVK